MSRMEKTYEPSKHEAHIYKMWEDFGAFKPAGNPKKPPFSIIMPPPNANGHIHVGTAMFTVEDIMIRYRRMKDHPTLWLPGTDHAGIETQVVFERELAKEGKSRFDYTPAEFYEAALAFTKGNQHVILSELKSMGFSADWSRLKFTLDDDIVEIVYDTFKRLHDDGLIYRGNRIVNWCPHCRSGFADIEIKHRQQVDPLYYIKYGPFVLATVRPETKFGDTAVAVNPKDEHYKNMIGKLIQVKGLLGDFKLKVIGDEFVDPAFGTGVIKVTPAHDPNDWEIGQRHNLEVKQVIGTDGLLTKVAGKYAGMTVEDARQQVAHDLEERGLIDHIEMNYTHNVAYHDRCGTQIEPLVTEQWWLKVKPLTKPIIKAVADGEIELVPSRFKKVYTAWLENLRDWNISRQTWFGIRIPVYYNATPGNGKDEYRIFSHENEAKDYYGEGGYELETDTFDTWFSSSQWPFATLMSTGDFDRFYPTSVMETGRDILTIWVTRMAMLGMYRTGGVPFKTIYLHGLVNDAQGKKMSKSKGNVINPLDVTAQYGTDALRLALTIGITPGNDGALSEKKVEGYRNFNNKLWNVARFVLDNSGDYSPTPLEPKSLADRWIIDRFSRENVTITKAIESYGFSEAGQRVYSLLWDDLANWYLEASKVEANIPVLVYVLEIILKLAHPFAPFVTEAIWQNMPWQKQNLIISSWPEPSSRYSKDAAVFSEVIKLIEEVRAVAADLGITKPTLLYAPSSVLDSQSQLIKSLARLGDIKATEKGSGLRLSAAPSFSAWLDVDKRTLASYQDSVMRRRDEAREYLSRLKKQLANPSYTKQAPADVVQQTQDRAAATELLLSKLDEQLKAFTQ